MQQQTKRMIQRTALVVAVLLLGVYTSVHAATTDISFNDFFADPAVTVAPDGFSATMAEDAVVFFTLLANDPGLGDPNVVTPGTDFSLSFDYVFTEESGSDDEFGAFIVDSSTGFSAGPAFEFFTQDSSSGTITFDLSPLVGQTLGLQFQLASDINFSGTDTFGSTVFIENVALTMPDRGTVIPLPAAAWMGMTLLGGMALRHVRRRDV